MADAVKVNPEQRMLIDGKLVEADSGKTFENVNPATEEVLGSVADASSADLVGQDRLPAALLGPAGSVRDVLSVPLPRTALSQLRS